MLVMKFGGASVKDAAAIKHVAAIIQQFLDQPTLTVISASGKMTNHLEVLAELARTGKEQEAWKQLAFIEEYHTAIIEALFEEKNGQEAVKKQAAGFVNQIKRIVQGILLLEEFPPRTYDRIVAFGELLSTTIFAAYLKSQGVDCQWLDARKLVRTDATYKAANVIWSVTRETIRAEVLPIAQSGKVLITQGFIAATESGHTTTLGREGSDYTGAIFAHCLEAERMMVWKDVRGILNADPRRTDDTIKHDHLSYEEAVEMTFYGASVIHPKTIKPLFNKGIPLQVKSFVDLKEEGTVIGKGPGDPNIASTIFKDLQALIKITPKDFSFMDESHMREIFSHVYKSGLKVNLMQNTAISLLFCVDDKVSLLEAFMGLVLDGFDVEVTHGHVLKTVLNFSEETLLAARSGKMTQRYGNKLFVVE
ncbi:MAG: aspartate kinase [Bacteroidia bacterium]